MLNDMDFERQIASIKDDRALLEFVARQTFQMSKTCIECQRQLGEHEAKLFQHDTQFESGTLVFGELKRDIKALKQASCGLAPARWWGVMIGTAIAIIVSAYTLLTRVFPRLGP